MIDRSKKFYVTTPIYYVTAKPHLGSLYSTVLADVAARWFKLRHAKTFFLTGTDEHGQKIAEAAAKAGKLPKAFVDSFISDFKKTWHDYHIDYSCFIRTTDEYHVRAVQQWLVDLQKKGDIYKDYYQGWYCTPCETFVTEKDAGVQAAPESVTCVSCGRLTNIVAEESYFFRLSAYQDRLIKFYENNPDFITPRERLAEVVSFVREGLKDLSISRTTVTWGIPFPGDSKHVTYVWADALNNYISAIGYGNSKKQEEFNFWWPADLQVIGKDIVRFHAVYWPAFLMAAGLELPKRLLVHGWITVNNQKMSKSFGNVVDPHDLLSIYGADEVRYYLTRYMTITHDAEFSTQDLEQRISADLANDLGNLLNRMTILAHKNSLTTVDAPSQWREAEIKLKAQFDDMLNHFIAEMEHYFFYKAYAILSKFISEVNSYFHAQEPWKKAQANPAAFNQIISATCHCLYSIAVLAWPVMPEKMTQLLASLGESLSLDADNIEKLIHEKWVRSFTIMQSQPLFAKYETKPVKSESAHMISIEEFKKVELVVGTIISCEPIEKSDKLWKLKVDFGSLGTRQILSGIKQFYSGEDLMDKQAVFVFNLQPRSLMGHESQGMILTALSAEPESKPLLIIPQSTVPNGSHLK